MPKATSTTEAEICVEGSPEPNVRPSPLGHNDGGNALVTEPLSTKNLILLSALRFFSAWCDRSSTFAIYLFLVIIFPSTLLPASIYGFCTTAGGILLSGFVGSAIDKYHRHQLAVFQFATFAQKLGAIATYTMCLLFLLTSLGSSHELSGRKNGAVFLVIVASGVVIQLSNVCISISLEREWVSIIAQGSSTNLTVLNAWLRRIDLTCDLLAPIFVSSLSVAVSYSFSAAFLCGMAIFSLCIEIPLSNIVYRVFPELRSSERPSLALPEAELRSDTNMLVNTSPTANEAPASWFRKCLDYFDLFSLFRDFLEFGKLPVFYTTLSIASIYLTVLSFDGTMITFLKNTQNYSDPFIAAQRAACTIAGLSGTLLFPFISRKIGLVRTGSWAIWSEFACLVPVVVSLYLSKPADDKVGESHWNAALLFTGMACSRVFLWMFDLAQLQILQESLNAHPKRNRLTSFQYVLQNVFDMAKYALTMGLARPSQFRWAGLASLMAVFTGGTLYSFGYALRVRGHLLPHPQWLSKLKRT